MVDFNLIIKDHIHGLVPKLLSNYEQDINTLSSSYLHPNFKYLNLNLKDINTQTLNFSPLFNHYFHFTQIYYYYSLNVNIFIMYVKNI
jgi:hypothetical protein